MIEWIVYIFVFLFGASVFSFVNVLIYRVPRHMPFGKERSICPRCGKVLKGYDMIPVVSFLLLGGRCRYCKAKIAVRYPLVEGFGGALAVAAVYAFGKKEMYSRTGMAQALVVFALLAILTAVAFVDIDTMEIPNGFVIAVFVLAVVSAFLFPEVSLWERGAGMLCVSVPMLLLTAAIPGAFGGGDIKLMGGIGLFLGWKLCLAAFVFAVFGGGFYGMYLLAAKKKARKDHFAFGPFLCVGAAVALFVGERVIRWYMEFL